MCEWFCFERQLTRFAPGNVASRATATLRNSFKRSTHLAVRLPASHMTVSQAGPTQEHDAVTTPNWHTSCR
jgi:hypothetical protein